MSFDNDIDKDCMNSVQCFSRTSCLNRLKVMKRSEVFHNRDQTCTQRLSDSRDTDIPLGNNLSKRLRVASTETLHVVVAIFVANEEKITRLEVIAEAVLSARYIHFVYTFAQRKNSIRSGVCVCVCVCVCV